MNNGRLQTTCWHSVGNPSDRILGRAYRTQGRREGAVTAFQRTLPVDSRSVPTRNHLEGALTRPSEIEAAMARLCQALTRRRDSADACCNRHSPLLENETLSHEYSGDGATVVDHKQERESHATKEGR